MRKIIMTFFAAMLLSAVAVHAQGMEGDSDAIKATLARFGNSWVKEDFSDMKDYMTPDCNWINIVGMHWKNLKEVQFAHQAFVTTMFKGVHVKEVNTTIRFITYDVAVAYKRSHIDAFYPPDGVNRGVNKQGDTDNLATFVLVKQNGKWMITSAQNCTVVQQAAASDPVLKMPH